MPKKSFFVGLIVGLAGVIFLYAIAAQLYEISVAQQAPTPVGVPQQPPPPDAATKPQVSSNGGDTTQVDNAHGVPDAIEPEKKTDVVTSNDTSLPPELPTESARTLAGQFPVVEVPGTILDVALDAELGRLAVVGPFGESLGVYDTSDLSKRPQFVALDEPVTSVACKPLDDRRLFVVGIDTPPRLVLVDAETFAVIDSATLDTSAPRQLAASLNTADPHIIYLTGPDLKGPRVFDLRQLAEVDSLGPGIVDAAFSSDGQTLFFRSSSRKRAVGLFSERRTITSEDAPAFEFERVGNKLGSNLPMYIGSNDWFVAAGKGLLSTDLQREFATVSFEPQGFFSKKPWMAGMNKERFCIGSINDYRTVVRIDVPADWLDLPPDAKPIGYRPRELRWQPAIAAHVFADEKNDQFLLATPRHLVSFPLAKLRLPAEQVLWGTTHFPETLTIGKPWSIQLQFAGQPDAVSLAKHPPGMVLNGMTLQWTPQARDFGDHEIEIVAKSGDVERCETRKLHTERAHVESPFAVTGGIDICEDGRRAAVWGEKVDGTSRVPEFKQLGVIDLALRRVVATRELPKPFSTAKLIGDDLYVLRRGQLERLSAETLEDRSEPSATSARAGALTVFGEGHRPWRFDLNTLKRLDEYPLDVASSENGLTGPTAFGWVSEGVLWNEDTGEPKLLLWPFEFRRTPWQHTIRSSPQSAGEITLTTNTWHPCSHNLTRSRVSSFRSRILFTAVSSDLPATLAITQDTEAYNLSVLSLKGRRELLKTPLVRKPEEPFDGDRTVAIATQGETCVVLLQGRFYFGSLRSLQESIEGPFHVRPQQSVVLLRPDRPTKVRYEAGRAKRFYLESQDLALDGEWSHAESASGEFTLSVAEAIDKIVESHVEVIANLPAVRTASNKERLEYYRQSADFAFVRILRRNPDGVPIPVRVFVTAEGDDFQKASISHDFLVDVPLRQFEVALDKKYPLGRDPWKKPDDDHAFDRATDEYPDELSPPSGSNRVFAYMRRVWANIGEPAGSLREAAAAAKTAGDERLRKQYVAHISKKEWRTWTDKQGNRIEALFVKRFAGQVMLKTRRNAELALDEDGLGEADRQYLAEREEPVTPSDTDTWRAFIFRHVVRGVNAFHQTEKMLPPRALVDDSGRPTLSWRVLLLPQLGYEQLFSLFRLNEPWNSEHNRVLLEFMPDCLAVDIERARQNKTTMLTIASPRSAIRTDRALSMRDISDGADSTVVFVEAVSDRAAPWTQPADLALYDLAQPLDALRSRKKRVLVGVLSGMVITLPAACTRETWRHAIEDGDRKALGDPVQVQ